MFESLDVPVFCDADVVIAGAGPAGIGAAIASAMQGRKTVLLEQTGSAGGMSTNSLIPIILHQGDGKRVVVGNICHSIVRDACAEMGIHEVHPLWQSVDTEALKRVCDRRLLEAGVKVFYMIRIADAIRRGNRIEALLVATSSGLQKVTGRVFVDCTGDGSVAAFAGVPFDKGDGDGNTMSPTLCAQYTNVDMARYREAKARGRSDRAIWMEMAEKGVSPVAEFHFPGFWEYSEKSGRANVGHLYGTDTLDDEQLTRAYIEGRKLALVYHNFYREHVPGFENSELSQTAALMGVRESRRVRGDYQLSGEDYRRRASFPDEIGRFNYPIDIHSSGDVARQKEVEKELAATMYKWGENYGVPYRALVAQEVENLLVGGRCISCDREAQSSIRVIPGCFLTGQAAGAAAAMSAAGNGAVRSVDVEKLRAFLRDELEVYLP